MPCYNAAALIRLCSSTELQRSLTDKIPTNRRNKIPLLYTVASVHFYFLFFSAIEPTRWHGEPSYPARAQYFQSSGKFAVFQSVIDH